MNQDPHIEDLFLKALIKNDGLKTPSRDFTKNIMAKIPTGKVVVEESSRFLGRNLTMFIFFLVGVINLVILYFIWPYLSVWLPENSILAFMLENANNFLSQHISQLFERSATISLLLIIGLGLFILLGRDETMDGLQKLFKKLSI